MEVLGFIFGIIALGTASSALAKIAALEQKLRGTGACGVIKCFFALQAAFTD